MLQSIIVKEVEGTKERRLTSLEVKKELDRKLGVVKRKCGVVVMESVVVVVLVVVCSAESARRRRRRRGKEIIVIVFVILVER